MSATHCTNHREIENKNMISLSLNLQVGVNGHPCPLHLNPPSLADLPLGSGHFYFQLLCAKYNYGFGHIL
jgi:hypothetical protein